MVMVFKYGDDVGQLVVVGILRDNLLFALAREGVLFAVLYFVHNLCVQLLVVNGFLALDVRVNGFGNLYDKVTSGT